MYTPGPWHIGMRTAHAKRDIYGEQGELIALADGVFTDLAIAQANARLIAAAPEMYEALKRFGQTIQNDCFDEDLLVDIYHDVRNAIAKAEGRANE